MRPDSTDCELISVRVELKNDRGDTQVIIGHGESTDHAVANAEEWARKDGDDSWTMNDWRPA